MSPVDVVIVGGGPTGLMLAGELRLGGVEVVVLERLAAPTGLSKAPGVTGRGAQTLNYRGLLDRFDGAARGWAGAKFTHFGGIPLDLGGLSEHLPFSLMAPQAQIERVLEEWAVKLGARLRRGHQVTELTRTEDQVRLQVDGPEGGYRLDARYVVGCDGARSLVRRAAGTGSRRDPRRASARRAAGAARPDRGPAVAGRRRWLAGPGRRRGGHRG